MEGSQRPLIAAGPGVGERDKRGDAGKYLLGLLYLVKDTKRALLIAKGAAFLEGGRKEGSGGLSQQRES